LYATAAVLPAAGEALALNAGMVASPMAAAAMARSIVSFGHQRAGWRVVLADVWVVITVPFLFLFFCYVQAVRLCVECLRIGGPQSMNRDRLCSCRRARLPGVYVKKVGGFGSWLVRAIV
jgi:hypothetical protein